MLQKSSIYLVLKNIPDRDWSYKIEHQPKVIGRSPDAHIRFPARFERVSRRHAEVWTDKYGTHIRDLHSRSGTCINDVWVDHVPQATIVVTDTIGIGGAELKGVDHVDDLAQAEPEIEEADLTPAPMPPDPPGRSLCRRLTPAEIEVVLWIGRGYHDRGEVGKLLHRAAGTVHKQRASIFQKLDVHSCAELMGLLERAHRAGGGVCSRQR